MSRAAAAAAAVAAGMLAFALALAPAAHADPDLRVLHAPAPQHLKMRTAAAPHHKGAAVAPAPVAQAGPHDPHRVAVPMPPAAEDAPIGGIGGLRDPNQPVTFQLDAGYAIDGTEASPSGKSLSGSAYDPNTDYARIRTYGFSDAYVGTHGVGYAPLQTFFSARAELTQPLPQLATPGGGPPVRDAGEVAPPIADWFTRSNLMIRSAWGELRDVSDAPWLAPLRVRAGEIYVYGPWIAHIRGAIASWETKLVTFTAYDGIRAPDYAQVNDPLSFEQAQVRGASARIDLRGITNAIPLSVGLQSMQFGAIDGSPATTHTMLDIDWRPRRDIVVHGEGRTLDGDVAAAHLQLRGNYKLVSNALFDLQYRSANDWQWDPSLTQQDAVGEARRYLDLGPVVPQVLGSLRLGTVLFDNVDLLLRGAAAFETGSGDLKTAYSAPYAEFAAATDVRVRRTFTIGTSFLTREDIERQDTLPAPVVDSAPTTAEALADLRRIGELGFTELGVTAKMSLGARRFSAGVEAYGRRTHYQTSYCGLESMSTTLCAPADPNTPFTAEIRGGGRVTIDAWLNKNLRMFASYDVSSTLAFAPEVTGYKSLRLVMEGVY
jgi:hypothetical protein